MKFCGISASALGLDAAGLCRLKEALDNPNGPMILWLQGSECTGCSVSFLNRISIRAPSAAKDVLIQSINLADYPNLMAPAGKSAPAQIEAAYSKGGYVLAIEGGVPTNSGWSARWAWSGDNQDVTLQQAVLGLSAKAGAILAVGTCAAFGGTPGAPPNPKGEKSVKNLTGKRTINIAGCPPHPDRIAWVVVQLLLNKPIFLDSSGRPRAFFNRTVRRKGGREETETGEAGPLGVDDRCMEGLDCRGKQTLANCPRVFWSGRSNRCKDGNAPCFGCMHSNFPDPKPFYKSDD
jgi:NiFe hydrogenase small subunit HydA